MDKEFKYPVPITYRLLNSFRINSTIVLLLFGMVTGFLLYVLKQQRYKQLKDNWLDYNTGGKK